MGKTPQERYDQEAQVNLGQYTFCEDCKNLYVETANTPKWKWQCFKHPRLEGRFGWLSRTTLDALPGYLFCKDVNGGYCLLFEPKRGEDDESRSDVPKQVAQGG